MNSAFGKYSSLIWSIFFISLFPVLGQEPDSDSSSVEKKMPHNFVSLSYGEGNTNGIYDVGRTRITKLAYEYRFHPESG